MGKQHAFITCLCVHVKIYSISHQVDLGLREKRAQVYIHVSNHEGMHTDTDSMNLCTHELPMYPNVTDHWQAKCYTDTKFYGHILPCDTCGKHLFIIMETLYLYH